MFAKIPFASIALPAGLLIAAGLIAGCAAGGPSGPVAQGTGLSAAASGLSLAQIDIVTAAAREMVADPGAQVHGLKSRGSSGGNGAPGRGLDVCGYVKTASQTNTPLYVELRDGADGGVTAARGQIGATPANLSKVRFMCRNHGDW